MVLKTGPAASVSTGDIELAALDFTDQLDPGELLTGTPTVAEQTTSDLTLADKAVNTATVDVLGRTVTIGMAVQFSFKGGTAGTSYTIQVTVSTDATPARTFVRDVDIKFD